MASDNIAQNAYLALMKAANAKQKKDSLPASVNYTRDLHNKRVTGNFTFSFVEEVDESTGEIRLVIADSLTNEESLMEQSEET